MRAFTRVRFRRTWRRRAGAACACVAYLLAALHIPLPASARKDVSQPFPCQNHPCGCQTAEQCWRHCCCLTPQERWAWARANHVEPPAYAEKPDEPRPAAQGWNTVKLRDRAGGVRESAAGSCCAAKTRPACCKKAGDAPRQHPPADGGRVRWGAVMAAWQCQGMPMLWLGHGAVVPVPLPASWSPDDGPPAAVALTDALAWDVPFTPPTPPPRRSAL